MAGFRIVFICCFFLFIAVGCDTDESSPTQPADEADFALLSRTVTPGWAEGIFVHGNTAFVADGEFGVTIWDVSDGSNPVLIDTILTNLYAQMVAFAPLTDLVLVGSRLDKYYYCYAGVEVYNFTTKRRLFNLWDPGCEGFCFNELSPDTIVIAEVDRYEGFKIVKAYYDSSYGCWLENEYWGYMRFNYGTIRGLTMDNNYAYVGRHQWGLGVLEIDYSQPYEILISHIGSVDTPGAAGDVSLNGNKTHAIVGDYMAGIQVIDVTVKSSPTLVGSLQPDGVTHVERVVTVGDTTYFTDENNGFFAADVSDPEDPILIGKYYTPDPKGIFVTPDHTVYLADAILGLIILSWQ